MNIANGAGIRGRGGCKCAGALMPCIRRCTSMPPALPAV